MSKQASKGCQIIQVNPKCNRPFIIDINIQPHFCYCSQSYVLASRCTKHCSLDLVPANTPNRYAILAIPR